jgi:hypothetical protein
VPLTVTPPNITVVPAPVQPASIAVQPQPITVTDAQMVTALTAEGYTVTAPATPPPPPTGMLLGVYNGQGQGITNGMPNAVSSFVSATGLPISVARYYLEGSGTWATLCADLANYWKGTTAVRMNICIPFPTASVAAAGGISKFLANGASGGQNAAMQAMLEQVAALFPNAILSPWWEWDGGQGSNNVPATEADYANLAAFTNQFATVARAVSPEFHIAWYCGGYDYSYQSWWSNCVPAASSIDSVSLDFYDQFWNTVTPTPAPPGLTLAQHQQAWTGYQLPILKWLAAEAAKLGKPMFIGEFGIWQPASAHYGGDDPYWVTDFCTWLKTNNVFGACYFNSGPNVLSAAPESLAALKEAI